MNQISDMKFLGFLKKEKKEAPVPRKPIEVKTSDILEWFGKNFQNKLKSVKSKANEKHSKIENIFLEIQKLAEELEKATFAKTEKAYTMANMLKDSFVTKIKSSSLPDFPEEIDYSSLSDFHSKTQSLVNSLLSMSPKQSFFLSRYFAKEAGEIIANIKHIKEELSGLRLFIEEDAKIILVENEINRFHDKLNGLTVCNKEREKELAELNVRKKSIEKELGEKECSLKDLLDSREWKSLNEAQNNLKKIQDELEKTENILKSELESVKRPLKKIAHIKQKPVLEPFKTVMEGKEKALLAELKESVSLDLKPREKKKVNDLIKRLDSEIQDLTDRYKKLLKNKKEAEERIEKFDVKSKKEQIEEAFKRKNNELETVKKKLLEIKNSEKRTESQSLELGKEIEKIISENTEENIKLLGLK